jgi:hypothetical protein
MKTGTLGDRMNKLAVLMLLFSTLLMSSCAAITIQTANLIEGQSAVRIAPSNGMLAIALKVPTLDRDKGRILESESYAINKAGERFGLIVEPNEYANNYPEPSYFASIYVWLKGENRAKRKWENGKWTLVLILQRQGEKKVYKAKFELITETGSLPSFKANGEF